MPRLQYTLSNLNIISIITAVPSEYVSYTDAPAQYWAQLTHSAHPFFCLCFCLCFCFFNIFFNIFLNLLGRVGDEAKLTTLEPHNCTLCADTLHPDGIKLISRCDRWCKRGAWAEVRGSHAHDDTIHTQVTVQHSVLRISIRI